MAQKALHDLPHPLPALPFSLPLTHSASATWASQLFLQHTRHSPAPGPLHVLYPLPGTPALNSLPQLLPPALSLELPAPSPGFSP